MLDPSSQMSSFVCGIMEFTNPETGLLRMHASLNLHHPGMRCWVILRSKCEIQTFKPWLEYRS